MRRFCYILTGFTGTTMSHTLFGAPVEPELRSVLNFAFMNNGILSCTFFQKLFLLLKTQAYYGCYCGKGTDLSHDYKPTDAFDAICKTHDYCWGAAQKVCGSRNIYTESYSWKYSEDDDMVSHSISQFVF